MEVDIRVEVIRTERVDLFGKLLRDVRIPQMFPHHRTILGFCQRVIVSVSWTRFGELDAQLLQQRGDLEIDILRAIIRMESQDDKRKSLQQLPDDRQQIRLADRLAGRDQLEPRSRPETP